MTAGWSRWRHLWAVGLALLLLVLCGWLYWPGTAGPALLDDTRSLTAIERSELRAGQAGDYIFAESSGPLGRPVSIASFALEKYFLDAGVPGHKQVNVVLHLVNGLLVMWLFVQLLRRAGYTRFPGIAILCGAAWLFSPLYVSTVLYSVQRMAMLACTFMLLTLILYIHLRQYWPLARKWAVLVPLPLAGVFALGLFAKENAVVVLPLLLLLELAWFDCRDGRGVRVEWLARLCKGGLGALSILFFGVLLLLIVAPDWLPDHAGRSFTVRERVLTETRVLWDYLGQLLLPERERMGLYHDDWRTSVSLRDPAVTLWAVLAWCFAGLSSLLAWRSRRGRYLVFALLFYLVGHSVESTILPLELYFEHRAYFPGIGLFLAVALSLAMAAEHLAAIGRPLQVWLVVWVVALSLQTSYLVQVWSDVSLLRLHHLNGHPRSARANVDMASQMAVLGALDEALRYSAIAHELLPTEHPGDLDLRDIALGCMAGKPLPASRDWFAESPDGRLFRSVVINEALIGLILRGQCHGQDHEAIARKMSDHLIDPGADRTVPVDALLGLAMLENHLEDYRRALAYTEAHLVESPGSVQGWLMKLQFTSLLQLADERQRSLQTLRDMQTRGLLSYAESETLALYGD